MIVYIDASALVKRYVAEHGSSEVIELTAEADIVATSVVSRAEVAAALARGARLGALDHDGARRAQRRFLREWPNLARVPVTELLVSRAGEVHEAFLRHASRKAYGIAQCDLLAVLCVDAPERQCVGNVESALHRVIGMKAHVPRVGDGCFHRPVARGRVLHASGGARRLRDCRLSDLDPPRPQVLSDCSNAQTFGDLPLDSRVARGVVKLAVHGIELLVAGTPASHKRRFAPRSADAELDIADQVTRTSVASIEIVKVRPGQGLGGAA